MTILRKHALAITVAAIMTGSVTHQALAQHAGHSPDPSQKSASDSSSNAAYKASHDKMMKAMEIELTGDADVDFVRNMIPHHQGAVDMAEVELAHGKNPTLKKMAKKIIADQKKEIAAMQAWLKKNGK